MCFLMFSFVANYKMYRVVRSVVFTTATIARLMVQLPPKLRCCILGKDALRQFSLLGVDLTSSKLKKSEANFKRKTWKQGNS